MMYDDDTLYVVAELVESKIWGTTTEKNSTLYHENNFEVFSILTAVDTTTSEWISAFLC